MDEQLEVAFEGTGMENQPVTPVPPGSEAGTAEEKAEEAVRPEEINELSTRGEAGEIARKETSAYARTGPSEQEEGEIANFPEVPLKKEFPPLSGQHSVATGVNDLPVAGQSRGVTEPQRDGDHASGGGVSESPRNYYAEWQELAEAHPEVVGKELPEDIYQECMRSELPPLRVYESMMLRKQAEQISALQQEIATLRQNAENTARAPVSAAAGSPENEPEDQFMQGFNSY